MRCFSISSKSRLKLHRRCSEVCSASARPSASSTRPRVEALEEAHVARLVGDLRRGRSSVLGRRGAHDRPQLLGHLLLADEERREPVHRAGSALRRRSARASPRGPAKSSSWLPLLTLPEQVELLGVEQLDVGRAIGGLHQGGVGVAWKSARSVLDCVPDACGLSSSVGRGVLAAECGLPPGAVRLARLQQHHLRGGLRLHLGLEGLASVSIGGKVS